MLQNVSYIELSGEKLPFRMDNLIVQLIQETYGTIKRFEYGIIGIRENTEGNQEKCEPSVAIMNFILPKMIEEGYKVLGEEPEYTDLEIIRMIDMNPYELASKIHEEMIRCFQSKKSMPNQMKKSEKEAPKTSRLTLIGCIASAFREWASQKKA